MAIEANTIHLMLTTEIKEQETTTNHKFENNLNGIEQLGLIEIQINYLKLIKEKLLNSSTQ